MFVTDRHFIVLPRAALKTVDLVDALRPRAVCAAHALQKYDSNGNTPQLFSCSSCAVLKRTTFFKKDSSSIALSIGQAKKQYLLVVVVLSPTKVPLHI